MFGMGGRRGFEFGIQFGGRLMRIERLRSSRRCRHEARTRREFLGMSGCKGKEGMRKELRV